MNGMNPAYKKGALGWDTDNIRKSMAPPSPEDKIAHKRQNSLLRYGMSKESPFLAGKPHEVIHPSTKVIFGEPEKKVRPFTSKASSMNRKSLLNPRNRVKEYKANPAFKNSFGQFAKCSMSTEKQKLISFYASASTLKNLRKKVSKCKYTFLTKI